MNVLKGTRQPPTGSSIPLLRLGLMLAVACCLWPVASSICAAEEKKTAMVGTLSDATGVVEIMKRGAAEWIRASNGAKVGTGDQINTGIDGKALLKFENSTTEIRPLTQFTVGRAMESDKEFSTEMFLSVGKLVSKANQVGAKTNRFTVTTPSAVAGIRGTVQEIGCDAAFGTTCEIEDGVGSLKQIDAAQLPPAVQMALGINPPPGGPPSGGPDAGGPEGAAKGAGPAVSEAATAAAAEDPKTAAAAVSAALDQWLEASFDNQVAAEEGGAEAGLEAAPDEAAAASIDEIAGAGEEILIDDGQSAAVLEDPTSFDAVIAPADVILEEAVTDITAAGTTDAEQEAALSTTDISDAPPSELAVEVAADETLTQQLLQTTVQDLGGTAAEVDLFGQPPPHP